MILLIGIVIVLAALILACFLFIPSWFDEPVVDSPYKITEIKHTDLKTGLLNYESYLVLNNTGTIIKQNKNLYVKTFVNGKEANCNIPTLNGDQSCGSNHIGVERIGGLGTTGGLAKSTSCWYPGQEIWINYENGLFHPGDTIRIDVYDKTTGKIISRDTWPHTSADARTKTSWWISEFTHRAS
jgi:hypothetical protein